MKILVVEDEKELSADMVSYLTGEQYVCETAATYQDAVDKIALYHYDCILLDLMLPGGEGMTLLEELKRQGKEDGVIIISAKNSLDDKIKGLQIGADDYLTKPFHLPELGARIFSLLRRRQFRSTNTLNERNMKIDLLAKSVTVNNNHVPLTKKEFDLLLYFIGNKNRVISKTAIAEHLSGDMADMFDSYDFIYAHIKNLKRKLVDAGGHFQLKTVYGTGYKWEE